MAISAFIFGLKSTAREAGEWFQLGLVKARGAWWTMISFKNVNQNLLTSTPGANHISISSWSDPWGDNKNIFETTTTYIQRFIHPTGHPPPFRCFLHGWKEGSLRFGWKARRHEDLRGTSIILIREKGRKDAQMLHMGVSKNRGTPKWMVYNGKPYSKWMIWVYHYFRKHPYTWICERPWCGSGKSEPNILTPKWWVPLMVMNPTVQYILTKSPKNIQV